MPTTSSIIPFSTVIGSLSDLYAVDSAIIRDGVVVMQRRESGMWEVVSIQYDGIQDSYVVESSDFMTGARADRFFMDGEVIMSTTSLTETFKERFIEGFVSAATHYCPAYDYDTDISTPYPWCAPWEWAERADYIKPGISALEIGADFFRKYEAEILEAFSTSEV